jgi:uncharacterized membrane protein YesL
MTGSRQRVGMVAAWEAIAQAVIDLRYVGVTLAYFNVLWFLCCLPVVTAPPATAALYITARHIHARRQVGWRDFLRTLAESIAVGWRWALVNLVAFFVILANLSFYANIQTTAGLLLAVLWWGIAFIWTIVQMYCFPVLLEQEKRSVRQSMRNAFVLVLRHPFFTLTYALVAGFFVFISVVIPYLWAVATPALLAFLYTGAVRCLVQIERGQVPEIEVEGF